MGVEGSEAPFPDIPFNLVKVWTISGNQTPHSHIYTQKYTHTSLLYKATIRPSPGRAEILND